ncbi:MAG: type IV pilus biogenesis/stability protein PilW [Gammaproteobacteria bacterium]|nr:type IV pilus biogenesis/stability protein PilW [Gammaproteobacteria bacterium]
MLKQFSFLLVMLSLSACTAVPVEIEISKAQLKKASVDNVQLGVGYFRQGKLELAKMKLEKAIKQDPKSSTAYSSYAYLLEQLNEIDEAKINYKKSIRLSSNDPGVNNNYGAFLCRHGEEKKAEKYFIKAVNNPLYKTPAFAYENAGICMLEIPDPVKAEEYFKLALGFNGRSSSSLLNLADLMFRKENYQKARGYLDRLHKLKLHSAKSLWLSIRTEHALGDEDAVSSYALLLKHKFPVSREARQLRRAQSGVGSY